MKIKKYVAPDIREVLRQIRAEQGPDAVILSTAGVGGQVEVTIAIDHDSTEINAARPDMPIQAGHSGRSFTEVLALQAATRPEASSPVTAAESDRAVDAELRTMRRMLETQLAALAWNDLARRAPLACEVMRELTEFGFQRDLVATIADALPSSIDLSRARGLALARLADSLIVTGERWMQLGGRIAFVGPAGVGKTSTVAKIAARWVMRYGAGSLALISADSLRFGAQEQLGQLARLLGCSMHAIEDFSELPAVIERLREHRLILIDSPGFGAQDVRLGEWARSLAALPEAVEVALTLSASTQSGASAEAMRAYSCMTPSCAVLTKLDECTSLGGVLSCLIAAALPLAYCSNGQSIAEDLRPARAVDLIDRAVQLAENHGSVADDELLTRRFGKVTHAAA